MTDYEKGWNAALEKAAIVAQPPMKARAKPGMWYNRRAKIAADIRACKVEKTGA